MALSTEPLKRDFKVSDVFEGSDDEVFSNVPQIIFEALDENDREIKVEKLKSILQDFYSVHRPPVEDARLIITLLEGMGTAKEFPRYGYILHSGKIDNMGELDPGEYNKEFLTNLLTVYLEEIVAFTKYLGQS